MKKKLYKIALASLLVFAVGTTITSCVNEDLNINPKSGLYAPASSKLGQGLYQFALNLTSPNVNSNNYLFFTQQYAETSYTDEVNYTFNRNQPRAIFNNQYIQAIGNIKTAKEFLVNETNTPEVEANKKATLEIAELLVWENLVNTFGNIPYSDAFKGGESSLYSPKYDDAKTIYLDLIKRLDVAISMIDVTKDGFATGGDFMYNGKMGPWKKTANAIKLRLGLNLADTDPVLAKQVIESAFQSGLYASSAEAFNFRFDSGIYNSPFYTAFVATTRKDYSPSTIVVDKMNSTSDPRRDVWFTKVNGNFVGGPFGTTHNINSVSNISNFFLSKEGPVGIISYPEVLLLLAEAAQRGFNVGGTAQSYYNDAVIASFTYAGIGGQAATYLAANPYDAVNWKKSIGEQAYITLFSDGYATWNFTRRLDFPKLVAPANARNPLPVRMPYSDQEYLTNETNVKAAAAAIGGDSSGTKLFWDVN